MKPRLAHAGNGKAMMRARSLLASSFFLLVIGTSAPGDPVDPKIQPSPQFSKWMPLLVDPRRAESNNLGPNKFVSPPSLGRTKPVDTKVLLAQARLPSLKEINLLAASEGGQALIVPNDEWFKPISGKEDDYAKVFAGQWAVYAFKDEKPAVFSKFSVLIIGQSSSNPKQIELLVANDSLTGTFQSVGQLNVVNAKMVKSPYQELSFRQTTAKYVKIQILEGYGCSACDLSLGQLRLLGMPVE
jgi:hypothetical protein